MEISSNEMSLLQLYRTAKMQLGGMLPNLVNLTLLSITPQNGMVAITQSTELFAQVPVDDEQIVSNPAPRTLPRNPTPQKQREHHLSSSSGSRSSSSETDEKSLKGIATPFHNYRISIFMVKKFLESWT